MIEPYANYLGFNGGWEHHTGPLIEDTGQSEASYGK